MIYDERTYRTKINRDRFHYFSLKHFETDLLIGISGDVDINLVEESALSYVELLRNRIEKYISAHPQFLSSLEPLDLSEDSKSLHEEGWASKNISNDGVQPEGATLLMNTSNEGVLHKGMTALRNASKEGVQPDEIDEPVNISNDRSLSKEEDSHLNTSKDEVLSDEIDEPVNTSNCGLLPEEIASLMYASKIAGTGPMAGIAGLFSEFTGKHILHTFGPNELIIENGGDIFAAVQNEIVVSVFAGESPLSEKIGIVLPAGRWGVCTSSGKVGPSLNYGNADALTTVCKSAVIADHLATGLSNQVKSKADINRILEKASLVEEVLFTVIIFEDQLGVKGSLEIVPL